VSDCNPLGNTISNASANQYVMIIVRDWGPRIGEQDQSRLFTKFMRLDSALNSVQRGAGLGLYLCRQLVEAMDGHIWIESQGIPSEGSTFVIALPRYTDEAGTNGVDEYSDLT